VSSAYGCAFVQTGVIGEHCHRDGFRQSRLLRATPTHCQARAPGAAAAAASPFACANCSCSASSSFPGRHDGHHEGCTGLHVACCRRAAAELPRHPQQLMLSELQCDRSVQVYTVDHEDGGRARLDVQFAWADDSDPVPVTPDDEIVCDVSAGYVCARDACSVLWHDNVKWFTISADALLGWQDDMLIEYDMHTFAPLGARATESCVARISMRVARRVAWRVPHAHVRTSALLRSSSVRYCLVRFCTADDKHA
jgi:hypothetical protein